MVSSAWWIAGPSSSNPRRPLQGPPDCRKPVVDRPSGGMPSRADLVAAPVLLLGLACSGGVISGAALAATGPAEDGAWPVVGKDAANLRYSGLDEIDTRSVSRLKVAWTFSTGIPRGHEAAPLVVNGSM